MDWTTLRDQHIARLTVEDKDRLINDLFLQTRRMFQYGVNARTTEEASKDATDLFGAEVVRIIGSYHRTDTAKGRVNLKAELERRGLSEFR